MAKSLYEYCIGSDDFLLLVQWDKEKNAGVSPRDVSCQSREKHWWRCGVGHLWEAPVNERVLSDAGCPFCSGQNRPAPSGSIARDHPQLAKEWHPTKNAGLTPDQVSPGVHRKLWWKCDKGHEWQAQVNARTRGSGCPVCGNRVVLPGENDLATTHPALAAQWHPSRNGSRTPESVVGGSRLKVWWQCDQGHQWQASVLSRTSMGSGCPVCTGKQVLPGVNDLSSSYPAIAAQWHPTKNAPLTPEQVAPFSNRKVWWLCGQGHSYPAAVSHRVQAASGCPYCSNRKVLVGFNDLAATHPLLARQWHPQLNGALTPQMVTGGSRKKVWWLCPEGHVWKALIYSRAGIQKSGCPVCAGKVKQPRPLRDGAVEPALIGISSGNGSDIY